MKKPKVKSKNQNSNDQHDKQTPKPQVYKQFSKRKYDYDTDYKMPAQETEKWYQSLPPEPEEFSACPNDVVNQLNQEAKQMLDSETNGYNIRVSKNSEQNWMRSVMAKGTSKDKMASYILMVQEKPLYNLNALRSLIALVKPGKKECVACIDLLSELFITDLLPPNRKLKKFSQHPLTMLEELSSGNPAGRRRRLISWYFEDQLKDAYREFVDSLRIIASETIEANKEKAITALSQLLEAHPEQEVALLSNLVNKMGDPSKKVAAKAMRCLSQVLYKHPNMKGVIMDEVEKLLFRPNIGQKARYYSVCFLTQIMFKKSDAKLAANIIKIYFSFFKASVKLGDVDSKMLSLLLTGVNRAYPFAHEAMDGVAEQMETLYKVVHIAPFHVSMQGLSLLFQVADYKNNVSDRFYSALYRKLLDPALGLTSHFPMFLNLVFQALKKDESIPRVRTFIKRLLQICCHLPVPMTCATLYMLSQVLHQRAALTANVLNIAVKQEGSEGKVAKSEDLPAAFEDDDSEDEHYEDVLLEDVTSKRTNSIQKVDADNNGKEKTPSAWVHKKEGTKKYNTHTFDPLQRNPLYANGELCSYSELCYLSSHFHPTIALFASQILNSDLITYSGDPLQDFTLIRFLERFSFKNPKKQPEASSSSLFAKRQNYSVKGLKGVPVTSHKYIHQDENKIPVDERYLFRYLQKRRKTTEDQKRSKKNDDDDSDNDSVCSEEFEDMLDDLLKKRGLKKDMDEELDEDFDEDVDFADEYRRNMTSKKSKRKTDDDEDDMSMDGDEADDSNEDMDDEDLEGDEDFEGDDNLEDNEELDTRDDAERDDDDEEDDFDFDDLDDNAEDMDFAEDSEDSEDETPQKRSAKGKKKKFDLDSNVFASAEEFSELLQAAGSAREGSSSAVSNKDKASLKQLNWESERDRWVKGFKNFTSGGKHAGGKNKGKPLGVKRPSFKPKKKKRF